METNQHIELIAKMGMEGNKSIMFHVQGISHVKDIVSALLLSSMFHFTGNITYSEYSKEG